MGIIKSTFSGYQLTGEDAEAFIRQISNPEPNLYAEAAIQRGEPLAREYIKNGFVVIKPTKEGKSYSEE